MWAIIPFFPSAQLNILSRLILRMKKKETEGKFATGGTKTMAFWTFPWKQCDMTNFQKALRTPLIFMMHSRKQLLCATSIKDKDCIRLCWVINTEWQKLEIVGGFHPRVLCLLEESAVLFHCQPIICFHEIWYTRWYSSQSEPKIFLNMQGRLVPNAADPLGSSRQHFPPMHLLECTMNLPKLQCFAVWMDARDSPVEWRPFQHFKLGFFLSHLCP